MKLIKNKTILLPALTSLLFRLSAANNAYAISGLTFSGISDINNKILCPIASAMFYILMTLSVIMILYGGFLYVTSGSSPEKVNTAHKTILYAAIGIVVALIAGAVPTVVANLFDIGVSVCT